MVRGSLASCPASCPPPRWRPLAAAAALLLAAGLFSGVAPAVPEGSGPAVAEELIRSWPSFRGRNASGVADGAALPASWDAGTGAGIAWTARVPGLAHSSPVVWGDRVFLTTAVSSRDGATFRPGLYGDGDASDDRSPHRFVVMALDAGTGALIWERTAHEGVPKDRRHIKATYANSTPATDGRIVVAMFGSEGVFAYSRDGERLWHADLGRLDLGAYDAPEYEWGYAASPILYRDLVLVQCDTQGDDFVVALDSRTGKPVWRTERDEPPSWGTPTIVHEPNRDVMVTNGSNFIRGYDPLTGTELWRLGGSSRITAPTPVFDDGFLVVASGRRPEKPIFVLRPGARGDITLPEGKTASPHVAWSVIGRGPYMPTPLIYRGRLYVLNNNGVFDGYELATGREIYRNRIPHAGAGFSASPVASDGRIYLAGEDGDVFVLEAGDVFRVLGRHPMGEPLMATPAISGRTLFLRGEKHVWAIRDGAPARSPGEKG